MTYSKAMAAIKSYPYPIKSAKEASAILGVGEKIASQCEEYVKTGKIAAAGR
jgi:DNA polymerase mu